MLGIHKTFLGFPLIDANFELFPIVRYFLLFWGRQLRTSNTLRTSNWHDARQYPINHPYWIPLKLKGDIMPTIATDQFERLSHSADWSISLMDGESIPDEKLDITFNQRKSPRLADRRRALMSVNTEDDDIGELYGIVTRDFSEEGCGFYSPISLEPDQIIRVVFPELWLELRVVRCHQLGVRCFDAGGVVEEWFDYKRSDTRIRPSRLRDKPVCDLNH